MLQVSIVVSDAIAPDCPDTGLRAKDWVSVTLMMISNDLFEIFFTGYQDACPLIHQSEGPGLGLREQLHVIVSSLYSELVYVVLVETLVLTIERRRWPDFGDR